MRKLQDRPQRLRAVCLAGPRVVDGHLLLLEERLNVGGRHRRQGRRLLVGGPCGLCGLLLGLGVAILGLRLLLGLLGRLGRLLLVFLVGLGIRVRLVGLFLLVLLVLGGLLLPFLFLLLATNLLFGCLFAQFAVDLNHLGRGLLGRRADSWSPSSSERLCFLFDMVLYDEEWVRVDAGRPWRLKVLEKRRKNSANLSVVIVISQKENR